MTGMSSKDDKGWAAPEKMEEMGAWRGGGGLEKEGDEAQLDGETCLSDRRAKDEKDRRCQRRDRERQEDGAELSRGRGARREKMMGEETGGRG